MNWSKLLSLGILAAGLVFSTTGCGLFESDEPEAGFMTEGAGPENGAGGTGGPDALGAGNAHGGVDPMAAGDWGKPGEGPGGKAGEWTPIPGLNFPKIYFAFDSDRIGSSEVPKLQQVAAYMKEHKDVGLIIEGNCDERGSEEYNRALGERRAIAAKEFLVSQGIDGSRFQTISYGEEKPADPGHNEQAWSKNRRDELIGAKMN